MTRKAYEFLDDSFLFDDSLHSNCYSTYTDSDLKGELQRYREQVISNLDCLNKELTKNTSRLKVFSNVAIGNYFSIQQLKQSALYLDQVLSPDPLFQLTHEPSIQSKTMSQFLGMPNSEIVDRKELVQTVSDMKNLIPMINSNYLKLFPLSYYFEPMDETPLHYSETGYADSLQPAILAKYREKADVRSLNRTNGGLKLDNSIQIGRNIAVNFEGDSTENLAIYNLLESEFNEVDDEPGKFTTKMRLPDEPPPFDYFQTWVNQSINQTALTHFRRLIDEFRFASNFKATYMTNSDFTNSLLGSCETKPSIENFTASCILNLELPFLESIQINDLMYVRDNDGEAFEMFRIELERHLRSLRLEKDPEKVRVLAENVMHELAEVQVAQIEQKMTSLKRGVFSKLVTGSIKFFGTVISSDVVSVAGTVSALASGYKSYADYKANILENPAYFLWKAKSRSN